MVKFLAARVNLDRLIDLLRATFARVPEVEFFNASIADGESVTVSHRLGRTPSAVLTEVQGGRADVVVTAKTEALVTITITTTPSSETRSLTLAVLG